MNSPDVSLRRPQPLRAAPTCRLPAGELPRRTRAVFVLDTSGSMRGTGDGQADIFERVKASVDAYVRRLRPDRVEMVSFDSGVRYQRGVDRPAENPEWSALLTGLKADGKNTYLYRSLHTALSKLGGQGEYLTTIFVLTDGIDNDPARLHTARSALQAFERRGALDRLHYVALGTRIPDDLRAALRASVYAAGHTYKAGTVPVLGQGNLAGGALDVTSLDQVTVPLPNGTPVSLGSAMPARLSLAQNAVRDGRVRLKLRGSLAPGSAALLCAPLVPTADGINLRPAALLLRLNTPESSGLNWLNPGADLNLRPGEDVVLRYRAGSGLSLGDLRVDPQQRSLTATLERRPGAREFGVRLRHTGQNAAQVTPVLLGTGRSVPLPTVRLAVGPGAAQGSSANPAVRSGDAPATQGASQTSLEGQPKFPARFGLLLLCAAALVGLSLLLRRRRKVPAAANRLPGGAFPVPGVEGLEYSEERTLALVTAQGDVMGIPAPLSGPFDVGQVSRVPHLSGLRAEQHRDGLQILRVPDDLEVSRGALLLQAGDVVRPGTLLGIAVAGAARAPEADLGSLAGLGLPLTLRADDLTVHISGPYGDHVLVVRSGVSDLGATLGSPVLAGLKLTPSGTQLLLVEVPEGLHLRRPGESMPLRPGTYLPQTPTVLELNPDGSQPSPGAV